VRYTLTTDAIRRIGSETESKALIGRNTMIGYVNRIFGIGDSALSGLEESRVAINTGLCPVFADITLSGLDCFSFTRHKADKD